MSTFLARHFAVPALILMGSASALSGSRLSGKWTVHWPNDGKNQPENEMSLTNKDGNLSGAYESDDKESCPVSGAVAEKTSHLILHIRCAAWGIELEGTAAADGKSIKGDYSWPSGSGQVTLVKHD
jgi:hypothetical protein